MIQLLTRLRFPASVDLGGYAVFKIPASALQLIDSMHNWRNVVALAEGAIVSIPWFGVECYSDDQMDAGDLVQAMGFSDEDGAQLEAVEDAMNGNAPFYLLPEGFVMPGEAMSSAAISDIRIFADGHQFWFEADYGDNWCKVDTERFTIEQISPLFAEKVR